MAQVTVNGKNALDALNRQKALQKLQNNATTEALEFIAQLVVKKDASEKLLSKKRLINTFF